MFLFFQIKNTSNVRVWCKKNPAFTGFLEILSLAMSYFHMGTPTLSSALNVFTSEFGMDSGGSHALLSPSKLVAVSGTGRDLSLQLKFGV